MTRSVIVKEMRQVFSEALYIKNKAMACLSKSLAVIEGASVWKYMGIVRHLDQLHLLNETQRLIPYRSI